MRSQQKLHRLKDLVLALDHLQEALHTVRKVKALKPLEKQLEKQMQKVFLWQGRIFIREMERYREFFPIEESIGSSDLDRIVLTVTGETFQLMKAGITQVAGKAILSAAGHRIADLGIDLVFDLANPRAVEYLELHAAERVTKINETTRARIATIVTKGTEEGWSYNQMAKEIKGRFKEFAVGKPQHHIDSRAHLVAVTETANAYEEGNRIVAQQMEKKGLQIEKSWLTVGDDKVSEGCQANQNAGWIGLDQEFPSGHQRSPRFPGCRCDILYRRKEESQKQEAELEQIIVEKELSIKDRQTEKCFAFDPQGNVIFEKEGDKNSIYFTQEESNIIKGHIFTHNHPSSSSFSKEDITTACNLILPEIRAVGAKYRHSMKPPDSGWSQQVFKQVIEPEYERASNEVYWEFTKAIKDGTMTIEMANLNHQHEVWLRVAKKVQLKYIRREW